MKLGDRSVVWWCAAGFWTAAMIRRSEGERGVEKEMVCGRCFGMAGANAESGKELPPGFA